jgi:hypothetical protein
MYAQGLLIRYSLGGLVFSQEQVPLSLEELIERSMGARKRRTVPEPG